MPAQFSPSHNLFCLPTTAAGADQSLPPIGQSHLGTVALGHFCGLWFDLMPALMAPYDEADMRRSRVSGYGSGTRRASITRIVKFGRKVPRLRVTDSRFHFFLTVFR